MYIIILKYPILDSILIMVWDMYGYSLDIKMDPITSYIALHLNWTLCSDNNSQIPTGCPTIQSHSNTNYPELVQTPHVKGQTHNTAPHQISAASLKVSSNHSHFFLADYRLRAPHTPFGFNNSLEKVTEFTKSAERMIRFIIEAIIQE